MDNLGQSNRPMQRRAFGRRCIGKALECMLEDTDRLARKIG